jgi:hypothetical protein
MKKIIVSLMSGLLMGGCVTANPEISQNVAQTNGALNRVAICIGLTAVDPASYNGWAGDCPGCDVDAKSLYGLFSKDGFSVKLLLNSAAIWKTVRSTILEASKNLKPNDLLIVAMSGHGGQLADDNGDEPSGMDSTLCLWDGQVRDDEFLKMINELPKGIRLVLINDQCHSEVNFKTVWRVITQAATLGKVGKKVAVPMVKRDSPASIQLIQFAGCREANYSYGSNSGGTWTQSLLEIYNPNLTWRQWFDKAKAVMPDSQVPVWTEYGPVTPQFSDGAVLR